MDDRHVLPFDLYVEIAARSIAGLLSRDETESFVANTMAVSVAQNVASRAVEDRTLKGLWWNLSEDCCSMVGLMRLRGLGNHVKDCIDENIPGDIVETGVWRGGASIMAALILKYTNCTSKTVHFCDSFAGLPVPDPKYPTDVGDKHHTHAVLAVSLETVTSYVALYKVDRFVQYHKGWFCDTAPALRRLLSDTGICILRLDGDMYGSTIEVLDPLYGLLPHRGFLVVDDWTLHGARKAVVDFRETHLLSEPIVHYGDGQAMYWRVCRNLAVTMCATSDLL